MFSEASMTIKLRTLAAAPLALAVSLFTAAPARASVIYTYTGNTFTQVVADGPVTPSEPYTTSDRVTGFMRFASPLAADLTPLTAVTPTAFSFSDGINTITERNATIADFSVTTDGAGLIARWSVLVGRYAPQVGGGTSWIMATLNFEDGFNGVRVEDFANDILCGSDSTTTGCGQGGDYFVQGASRAEAPGLWERRVAPVAEPSSILLAGAAIAGLAARRRARRSAR